MKILVTGISGFIGKNFLENFYKDDVQIIGIYNNTDSIKDFVYERKIKNVKLYKCDLTNISQVSKLYKKIGKEFDVGIFLSSNVDVGLSINFPNKDLILNVTPILNIFQFSSYKKIIYMSTSGVYDSLIGKVSTNTKLSPKNPYCISKLSAEYYIKYFRKVGGIDNYNIFRLGGTFGLYSDKKFITKLIKDIYINNKSTIDVYGNGESIIKTIYVKDLVNFLSKCIDSSLKDITCNLGQDSYTINEIIDNISKIFDKKVRINHLNKDDNQKYIHFEEQIDFNKIFNYKYLYTFREGIIEFAESLKNNV